MFLILAHIVFIIHFVKILGILGHSVPLGDIQDNTRKTNGVVVIKILQTMYSLVFVKTICLLGITLTYQTVNGNTLFSRMKLP